MKQKKTRKLQLPEMHFFSQSSQSIQQWRLCMGLHNIEINNEIRMQLLIAKCGLSTGGSGGK